MNEFGVAALLVVEVEPRLEQAASLTVQCGRHSCLAGDGWGVNDERSKKDQSGYQNDYAREHALPLVIHEVELAARLDSSFVPVVGR